MSAALFVVAMVGLARLAPVVLMPIFYRVRPLRPARADRAAAAAGGARRDAGDRRLRVGARRPHAQGQRGAGRHRPVAADPHLRHACSTPTPKTRSRSSSRTSCRITCTTTCGAAWRCRRRRSSPGFYVAAAVLDARGAVARAARYRRRRRGAGAAAGGRGLLVRDAAARQRDVAGPGASRRSLRAAAHRQSRRLRRRDAPAVAAEPRRGAAVAARPLDLLLPSADARTHRRGPGLGRRRRAVTRPWNPLRPRSDRGACASGSS